jgi:tRNA(Ile)-lysidine synthase
MEETARRTLRFIRAHGLLDDGDVAVVGFSGGPDSTALALLLTELTRSGALRLTLHLAHLNHCLRGAEADADEEFCRRFADRHGLTLHTERMDAGAEAEQRGGSLEAAARRVRYEFLGRLADGFGADAVATGHHADDVAETVLLRLMRGAGLRGLAALPPARTLGPDRPGLRLVRPLLELRKSELLRFLEERGEPFRIDSSNADTGFARNRVRHVLLPLLAREFPTFSVGSLCALNTAAVEVNRILEGLLDALWPDLLKGAGEGEVLLDATVYAAGSPALRKAAARRALERLAQPEPAPGLRAEHLNALSGLAEREAGVEVELPGGYYGRREQGLVYLSRRGAARRPAQRSLSVPGSVALPEIGLRIEASCLAAGSIGPAGAARQASGEEVFLSADALGTELQVRARRAGDRFHPLGMPGPVRLKKFLNGRKVPMHERERLPIVTVEGGRIAWVVGWEIADPFRLMHQGQAAVHLRAAPM